MATAKKAARKVTPAKKPTKQVSAKPAPKPAPKAVVTKRAPAPPPPPPPPTKSARKAVAAPVAAPVAPPPSKRPVPPPAPDAVTIASFNSKPRSPAELKADGFTHRTVVRQRQLHTGKTSQFTLDTKRELQAVEMKACHDVGYEVVNYTTVKL